MDAAPIPRLPPAPSQGAVTAKAEHGNGDLPRLDLPAPSASALTPKLPIVKPPAAPRPPEVVAAWPRCAQLAGAFLLGALAALLGIHALTYLRLGAEPSAIDEAPTITYRVDLNAARRAELMQLPGIGPSLADKIEEHRRTAGRFRSVDDLMKVKGIGPATLERVRPFVVVKTAEMPAAAEVPAKASNATPGAGTKLASLKDLIDVNQATLAELQKLPGIGPKMSQRIVDEREKRPFASVSDLRRVSGIGPKTLERLKPYVTVK